MRLDETHWFGEVKRFLESSPQSSLLAVVQEVLPEFQTVPPQTRAHLWFWMKSELHSLATHGVLTETTGEDHITKWALRHHGGDARSSAD